jgi:hypothetical protein
MDYNKLCKDILGLDPKIRFAGVCDETGEIRFGGQREGVKNLLTPLILGGGYGIRFLPR